MDARKPPRSPPRRPLSGRRRGARLEQHFIERLSERAPPSHELIEEVFKFCRSRRAPLQR